MSYKKLYDKIVENGKMPLAGLCPSMDLYMGGRKKRSFVKLMEPKPRPQHHEFWGSDAPTPLYYKFTPLRQNLLLLMAAVRGEL